jgi:hypothetical protein
VVHTISAADVLAGSVSLTVTAGDLGLDGSKSISARLTDPAGNSTMTGALSVILDTAAPMITIDQITGDDTLNGTEAQTGFDITGSAVEGAGQTITIQIFDVTGGGHSQLGSDLSSTVQGDGTWSVSVPAAEGFSPNHSYSVEAIGIADGAGNAGNASHSFAADSTVPCYCRGTLILTESGDVVIENLAIGDRVVTASGERRPIRAYDFNAGNQSILPIRIDAGAISDGVPTRDLYVSPEHAIYLDQLLLPARLLVNGTTIHHLRFAGRVEYFHIELETHDIIYANGLTAETFTDFGGRNIFHNSNEFSLLYPDAEPGDWRSYVARLEQSAAELPRIRQALLARSEYLGRNRANWYSA